ncbi:MAG: hypothetical protein A2252_09335 [Elusimicrobia bacterium RIFOXYA2_FULL_39_19]|nr:MAG: hypothetical protein A2252_09335 [Elusimicrobia bacterium RIFOXYA2_FULL_39_19]
MKRLGFLVFALFVSYGIVNAAEVIDKPIAVVNGEHILKSEYSKIAEPIIEQYRLVTPKAEFTEEKLKELKIKVLDQMIDDKLILQEANKQKIRAFKKDIEDGVNQIKKRFKTDEEFKSELKKEGLTEEKFTKRIEDQLKQIKLIDSEIKAKVAVPKDESVKALFEDIKSAIDGKELKEKTEEEKKNIDTLSKMIQREYGEKVKAKHILIRSSKDDAMTDQIAAKKKIEEIQAKLKKDAEFEDLAKEYSEDTGSADKGGDLGTFGKGEMVKEFDDVVFAMQLGDISGIIKSEFGYHIVKLEGKEIGRKLTYDSIKAYLADFLRQKDAEKLYSQWLKELRAKAAITTNPIE